MFKLLNESTFDGHFCISNMSSSDSFYKFQVLGVGITFYSVYYLMQNKGYLWLFFKDYILQPLFHQKSHIETGHLSYFF